MSQPVAEVGSYKNMTASGDVTTGPCQLLGFFVNSFSGASVTLRDGGVNGSIICLSFTLKAGYHRVPANIGTSLYAVKFGTYDITFFFAAGS